LVGILFWENYLHPKSWCSQVIKVLVGFDTRGDPADRTKVLDHLHRWKIFDSLNGAFWKKGQAGKGAVNFGKKQFWDRKNELIQKGGKKIFQKLDRAKKNRVRQDRKGG